MLSGLATALASLPGDEPQSWRLGEAMRRLLRADGAAITVEYLTEQRTTVYASDEVASTLESLQEVTGEGPGFDAASSNAIVTARLDEHAELRWPMLAHALGGQGFGPLTVRAIPVLTNGYVSGVATIYTSDERALTESLSNIDFLANAVGAALLADAAHITDSGTKTTEAWSSRTVVHQATGMVMAQVRLTASDALALLRGHAYATGSEITDVAARVVSRKINFSNFDVEGD